ncbi:uncharacterized protein LOC126426972 isoform X1 [Schistocerca serialis cubense]|uniref:uncharacterized protein LOC126426972 isoform X1 n=1 Tax=Schistocerca serialis cubense TaxID=2023355 RepID=UPI00214E1D55|nr:uncharacterized protein LOC126426972 isoform X1 [Schistocerca serialis cubense]XP_049945078.1 uncharacterized protein LOC126426972 isoform X1 [Schistocerca serialis cubense]XP_049945079.1 uncharacterized protein LOC126426972 isoform X1 [Schistocerca serialis cubense]XP_049945080.1 uncharacterized protein LOC126426972 isoform X1 [Schistocerca serialis cubense]XP_049945081.1 uncharacterized protein LOC126426972 isoform X1 [Schistocerca serialis cubense]XP_049945082.1 uncharacterized protein L
MEHKKTVCVKREETNECIVSTVACSMVQLYPWSVKAKEELQEIGNQEINRYNTATCILCDRTERGAKVVLGLEMEASDINTELPVSERSIKEEQDETKDQKIIEDLLGVCKFCEIEDRALALASQSDGSNVLEHPLEVSWSTDVTDDPRLNFGWDETENNNSMDALLDAILEAESECCPPPLLVHKKDLNPVTAVLVPLAPKKEPQEESKRLWGNWSI